MHFKSSHRKSVVFNTSGRGDKKNETTSARASGFPRLRRARETCERIDGRARGYGVADVIERRFLLCIFSRQPTTSARARYPPIVIGPVDFSGRPSVKLPMPSAPTDRISPYETGKSDHSHTHGLGFGDLGCDLTRYNRASTPVEESPSSYLRIICGPCSDRSIYTILYGVIILSEYTRYFSKSIKVFKNILCFKVIAKLYLNSFYCYNF